MPRLAFQVEGAGVVPYAAAPLVALKVRVSNAPAAEEVQAMLLSCQVRIDAQKRSYGAAEQRKLGDLFGEPAHWGRSLRTLLWTHAHATVPPFHESTQVDLPLPCSLDLTVAWTKYFYALEGGHVPLTLQFSGTVFYQTDGGLQVARVPADREATFPLDVAVWKEMMAAYYANSAFLSLRCDVFDRLYRYKVEHGLPTWEHALERLLPRGEE